MLIFIILFLLGLIFGSFLQATVWRIHEHRNFLTERSECEHCHHVLSAIDLIPILSWAMLKGHCRYCHKPLTCRYPTVELLTGLLFAFSGLCWPGGLHNHLSTIITFVVWLLIVVLCLMLALYDTQWHLLPDKILFPTIAITAAGVILGNIFLHSDMIPKIPDALMGVVIVCGFFGLLYFISKGKWIGFGDVKLGILIGLVLGAEKGALALVLSYYLGAIFVMPLLLKHKLKTSSVIPFGPFLLAAFFISFLFGPHIINWYKDLLEIKTTTS